MSDGSIPDTYFYRNRGEIKGPFTRSQMLSLVRRHRVGRLHEVSQDSYQWARASEFPELFEATVTRKVRKSVDAPTETAGSDTNAQSEDGGSDSQETFALSATPENIDDLPQSWHYVVNDEPQGPVPVRELTDLIAAGTVSPDDHVWADGMKDWLPISQVQDLAAWLPSQPLPNSSDAATAAAGADGVVQQPAAVLPQDSRKSALAISCMVLGILGVTLLPGIAAIPAVVLGHMAISEIDRNQLQGRGFAIAGIVLGYSAIGIALLLLLIKMAGA